MQGEGVRGRGVGGAERLVAGGGEVVEEGVRGQGVGVGQVEGVGVVIIGVRVVAAVAGGRWWLLGLEQRVELRVPGEEGRVDGPALWRVAECEVDERAGVGAVRPAAVVLVKGVQDELWMRQRRTRLVAGLVGPGGGWWWPLRILFLVCW